MQIVFLCKGPPIEWIYYTMGVSVVSLVLSFIVFIYLVRLLFSRPFYKNIENGYLKALASLGNIFVGFLGGIFVLLILLGLGLSLT